MRSLLLFFLALIVSLGYSQSKKVWIVDSLSHKPVNNVVMHTSKGDFYSNKNGVILLSQNFKDIIQIYRMGYAKKSLKYTAAIDTIFLTQKPIALAPIKVESKKKIHYFKIGYYDIHCALPMLGNFGGVFPFHCIEVVYIPSPENEIYINKILLKITSISSKIRNYNVYLYQPDSMGKPGKILFKKNIVVGSLKKKGIINVGDMNIKIPQTGIYVGVENTKIPEYDKNHYKVISAGITFKCTNKIKNSKTYILEKNPKLNPNKIWVILSFPPGIHETPRFGLEVYHK